MILTISLRDQYSWVGRNNSEHYIKIPPDPLLPCDTQIFLKEFIEKQQCKRLE